MRRKQQLNKQIFSRIGAIFLLLIFINIPVTEAFHQHSGATINQSADQNPDKKHYSSLEKKCKLCEVVKHQSPHFYLPEKQIAVLITQLLQKQDWHFLLQSSSCFILKCANKGPPVFTADTVFPG
ncbi:hypothetical protein TH53_04530 [Pedobacter lusitanus]|uniref:Uncharacterized protein n=1 Tax=Pedobacter lusitanus TaxID=1503925 RepID=A0A0D0GV58_9SPHI|nr:hypothetical protein TH53_04530 [Pedobacter lusitanus]